MYQINSFKGAELPEKTLCLTYDDGPGPFTTEIAKFLHDQDVKATFFVVGKYAYHNQEVLQTLQQYNHLIGNHTYDHPDLPYYVAINGDVQNQIVRTNTLIKKYIDGDKVYFRSPYGKWSKEVANELNKNLLASLNHVGPINWDIGGYDCYFWRNDFSIDQAVEKYLAETIEKGQGIILMHDDIADMDFVKPKNKTLELTKILIPLLKERGYKFIRLDEIETIRDTSNEDFKFTLKGSNEKYITLSNIVEPTLKVNGKFKDPLNQLSLVDLGYGKIAIKAANGLYFNSGAENEEVVANSNSIGEYEAFDLIPINSNQVVFRSTTGNYLTTDNKEMKLMCKANYMRHCEKFTYSPRFVPTKKMSLKNRFSDFKKQMLYIKSKIQQGN